MSYRELDQLCGSGDDSPLVPILRSKGFPIRMGIDGNNKRTAMAERGNFYWADQGSMRTFIWEGYLPVAEQQQEVNPLPTTFNGFPTIPTEEIDDRDPDGHGPFESFNDAFNRATSSANEFREAWDSNLKSSSNKKRDYDEEPKRSITFDE